MENAVKDFSKSLFAQLEENINPNVKGLPVSPTLAINEKSAELVKEGKTVYKFGLGQSPFPVPDSVVDALRLHAGEKDYLPVLGLPRLREAVAEFHSKKDLVNVSPENIIIGPGSKELLFLLQLVFKGDTLILSPSWVSYLPQAKILDKNISVIHTTFKDKWGLTAENLDKACSNLKPDPKLLIMNYPGNPDGMAYASDQLEKIAAVARKHQVIILSDEIYGQIHHSGDHMSIARYYPEGTIISSGLSKWCGAGGWRLGTFSFPKALNPLKEAMAVAASETFTSVSAPIQYAAIHAFRGGPAIENYLWHVRRILSRLGKHVARTLRETGASVHDPLGAFYLFIDFSPLAEKIQKSGMQDSKELCKKLLEDCGIALLPGQEFNREEGEFGARMAYVDFDGAKALSASYGIPLDQELDEEFLLKWCTKVLIGTKKMSEWINKL